MSTRTAAVLLTSHSVICSVRGRKAGSRLLTGQYCVSMKCRKSQQVNQQAFPHLTHGIVLLWGIIFTITLKYNNEMHWVVFMP